MTKEGWVEVKVLARLWAAVPERERLTEKDIRQHYSGRGAHGQHYIARELAVLNNPKCEIAVRSTLKQRKWKPCAMGVAPGEKRCGRHGGRRVDYGPRKTLKEENERLRALLEAHGIDQNELNELNEISSTELETPWDRPNELNEVNEESRLGL